MVKIHINFVGKKYKIPVVKNSQKLRKSEDKKSVSFFYRNN